MDNFDILNFVKNRDAVIEKIVEKYNKRIEQLPIEEIDTQIEDATEWDEAYPIVFNIKYKNQKGIYSERIITIRKLSPKENDIRIKAFCHTQKRIKDFLASSIIEIADIETGEVSENGIEFLKSHPFLSRGANVNLSPVDKAIIAVRDEVYLLALMAVCDDDFHKLEFDFIVSFIANSADEILDEAEIIRSLPLCAPDIDCIESAIRNIGDKEMPPRNFIRAIRNIIEADGILHESEAGFAQYLINILSK